MSKLLKRREREREKKETTNQDITSRESTVHHMEIMHSVSFWTHNRKLCTCSSHVFPDEHEHIVADVNSSHLVFWFF